jgi:uncharacterized protein
MVIDFRVQPPYASFERLHFFRPRRPVGDPDQDNPFSALRGPNPSLEQRSLPAFLDELDAAGVTRAVVVGQRAAPRWGSADNDDVAALTRDHPQRFLGVAGIDPMEEGALDELHRCVEELGCVGVALVTGWSDPPLRDDDEAVLPLYEACQRLGVLAMVTSSHYIGPDLGHALPEHVARVAVRFPDLPLVVSHACWPRTTQAVALAMRHRNVYLMPDFYLYAPSMPGARDYVDAANGFLRDRILFSSCYPTFTVAEALAGIDALPLSPSAREALLEANAQRLLDRILG